MTKLNYLLGQITNQFVKLNNKYEYEDVIRGFRFYDVDLLRPYAKDLINEEMYTSNPALMIRINPILLHPIFVSIGKGYEGWWKLYYFLFSIQIWLIYGSSLLNGL